MAIVLFGAAEGTTASISTTQMKSAIWVTEGSCTVMYDQVVLTTLTAGEIKVITIGSGEVLYFIASADDTTAKLKGLRQGAL